MELQEKVLFRACTREKDLQKLLLEAIKESDVEKLEDLLEEDRIDVNYVNTDDEELSYMDKTALQIACAYCKKDINAIRCIQMLIKYGADVLYEQHGTRKTAVHFAAESGNEELLKIILQHLIGTQQLHDEKLSNLFFTLIKHIRDNGIVDNEYKKVFALLLENDIEINVPDTQSGWTAIYAAAKYNFRTIVQLLLDKKWEEINLDDFKDRKGKSARDLIVENQLYSGVLPEFIDENSNITVHTLYKNIRLHQTSEFYENFERIHNTLNTKSTYTLLHMAVDRNSCDLVEYLLDRGIDCNDFDVEKNPLLLACKRGYHKIIKLFRIQNPNSKLVSECLMEVTKAPYTNFENNDDIDYDKCVKQLLRWKSLKINSQDGNRNTALHYAVRYQSQEMALELLDKGASMACRDANGKLPTEDMDSELLEQHLNNCITYDSQELSLSNRKIIINFTTLLPPRKCTIQEDTHMDNIKVSMENEQQEPLIVNPSEYLAETEVLQHMGNSSELKHLLTHPVILAFLYLKWHRIRMFFYINLAIYMLFVVSLITYITAGYNRKPESDHLVVASVSYVVLCVSYVLIVIRELFQMVIIRYRYFLTFENWLELVLLIVTTGILVDKSNETIIRQLSAVAIVTSAIEFLLLVGQFPSMSTNIMMLRTVSYTFFKLLLWYSILLLAFSYSFYTLFQETKPEENPANNTAEKKSNNDDNDDEEPNFFEDPGMSLLKTIVMLTGEFDATSIKFDSYPVISHIIFVMFVFLIAIVLFNLLNGLAVSDTQIIKNDAELYGQMLRVEHIAHVERVLLTKTITKWLPMVNQICLFPLIVNKANIQICPNENYKVNLIYLDHEDIDEQKCCFSRSCNDIYLEKKVQRAIRAIMKGRTHKKLN